ncbi:DNA excision repair protein ERCC-6-like [Lineus longissimus]|uniref:DNA excision repair protein ERCC-6-like n=1 Tax=Lineus longissimus TaxID=88925 RepID=UPI002B4E6C69
MEPLAESRQRLNSEVAALSEKDERLFKGFVEKARECAANGNVKAALEMSRKAYGMCPTGKLKKKIAKMEAWLADNESDAEEEEDNMKLLGNGFYLYHEIYAKLYQHQKEGVLWLWNLYKKGKGGILGDDMGLGKTIQVIAFLSGMYDNQEINSCLIVMPVSVIPNWEREFEKWAPGITVNSFHGTSKKERERVLYRTQRRGGVLLTSYGMVISSWEQLKEKDEREFVWDYVILDEGHKIKNPTKTSKGVHAIPARNRIILSGTPIQNNLRELWALYDFVHHGRLLGTQKTFKMEYENPITRSRERDATMGEKRLGQQMAESLKSIIGPYFLQRTKAQVNRENKENARPDGTGSPNAVMPTLSRKNDLVVWLFLTATQIKIYSDFLELDSVKELLMTTKSPLVALTVLKKICDHPRLMTTLACKQLGLASSSMNEYDSDDERSRECAANQVKAIPVSVLLEECGKLGFIVKLLRQLRMEGHRCLIFSQSLKMLDIIQRVLQEEGHKIMRLDGTVKFTSEREELVQKFQRDSSYNVFLLTTQVGGVGLTLTGADRVIIFDPSWNPSTDAQAVDRVFRIGQDKNVVVYRLITCGTVEEKIYRRQIFKDSINKQTTGNSTNPYRYFSKGQLRELFTMDDPHHSTTQLQLQDLHSDNRKTDPKLDDHLAFLYSIDIFGISDHDLMFSQEPDDVHEEEDEGHNNYIESRVQKARQLLSMEADQAAQIDGFSRPMIPDEPKVSRPAAPRQWEVPSSQPLPRPLPLEEDLVDLGNMDTSVIDDDEINRTLEELTLEEKPDHGNRRQLKEEKGGFAEVHGAHAILEHPSPMIKSAWKTEVIEVPESAENSLIEQTSDDSLNPGDSPDMPIAIADSDEDDLPVIRRPKPRNKNNQISSESENEDYKSPVKVIGIGADIQMESPAPTRIMAAKLEADEVQMFSPIVEKKRLALHDDEMNSPEFPVRMIADSDVEMDSPIVKKRAIIASDDEDVNMASPVTNHSRRSLLSESIDGRGLNQSLNTSRPHLLPDSKLAEDNGSPVRTVSKPTSSRRIIESDSEDESPGADVSVGRESIDLDGGKRQSDSCMVSPSEEQPGQGREGPETRGVDRRVSHRADSAVSEGDESIDTEESVDDETDNSRNTGPADSESDEGSVQTASGGEGDVIDEADAIEEAAGHEGEEEEELTEYEESGEEESEEETEEEESDDEVAMEMNKLKTKMKEHIAAKEYKRALGYAIKALNLDRSDEKMLGIVHILKKNCNL